MLFARLMHDENFFFQKGQSHWQRLVQRLRAEAAANDQQPQRTVASRKARLRWRDRGDLRAHGIAGPLRARQRVRKCGHRFVRDSGKHPVREAGGRVLLVHRERPVEKRCHHPAGKSHVAAKPEHHVRFQAADMARALPEGNQQVRGKQQLLQQAFSARRVRPDPGGGVAVARHQALLHAATRAHPGHLPAGGAHLVRHRQPGKDVSAGSACHDQDGFQACNPLESCRFSQSMRSRMARATKLTSNPEPP